MCLPTTLIKQTPLLVCEHGLSPIYLKDESQQETGAFKIRGVAKFLGADPSQGPVVTASTGNHGAAVATVADLLRRDAHVFVPDDTPAVKTRRITAAGAILHPYPGDYTSCASAAAEWADTNSGTYVPSFDEHRIIDGHAGLYREAQTQMGRTPSTVFAPVGGGGLLAAGILSFDPGPTRVVGVELAGGDAMRQSLAAGHRLSVDVPRGVAEGLCVREVGRVTFRLAAWARVGIQTATVDELQAAVYHLWHFHGVRAELAGAAAFAAAYRARREDAILAIISGGNIETSVFEAIIQAQHISEVAA